MHRPRSPAQNPEPQRTKKTMISKTTLQALSSYKQALPLYHKTDTPSARSVCYLKETMTKRLRYLSHSCKHPSYNTPQKPVFDKKKKIILCSWWCIFFHRPYEVAASCPTVANASQNTVAKYVQSALKIKLSWWEHRSNFYKHGIDIVVAPSLTQRIIDGNSRRNYTKDSLR